MIYRRSLPVFLGLILSLPLRSSAAEAQKQKESLSALEVRRRDAVEHFLRARILAADAELEEAIKEYRKAVELDPNDGNLRREYAEFLRDVPILPEALVQARKAVELTPDKPGARRVLGQVLLATATDSKGIESAVAELKKANDSMPMDPIGALSYGQALLRLGKASDAVPVLERVLPEARGPEIAILYGEALSRSGQLDKAEELYLALLRQDPDNGRLAESLLQTYERERKWDQAIQLLERYLKGQPGSLKTKVEYGSLLLRARRFSESEKVLTEVLKADPGNREALRQYATLLAETREPDRADDVLKKLQELEPEDLDVPFRRALNYIDARRVSEAERVLLDLRASVVKNRGGENQLAQVDGQLAYVAYLKKDYEAARTRLAGHLWGEGELNAQAFNLLLQVARDQERWAEGLKLCREVLAKSPKAGEALGVRAAHAEFLLHSEAPADRAEGEQILNTLAGTDRPGALAAADAWQRLERYGRAAETARKALETYKEDPDLLFRLAASLEREKKIAESVAAFEKLIAVRANHAPGLNYLGYLWADRHENLPRALDLIKKAVELEPTNGAYLDSLGWVYFQMNRLREAEEYLRAASKLNPDDATVEEHLGDLFEKKGDLEHARQSWKRALTLKPEDGGKKLEDKLRRTEGLTARAPKTP